MNIPEYKIARAVELLRSLDYTIEHEDDSRHKRGSIGEVLDILDPVKPEHNEMEEVISSLTGAVWLSGIYKRPRTYGEKDGIMSDRETRIVEVCRIEEAHALVDLARYIVRVSREKPLDDDEAEGMDYLLENIKSVIG